MGEENIRRLSQVIESLLERQSYTLESIRAIKDIYPELGKNLNLSRLEESAQTFYYDLQTFQNELSKRKDSNH